MNSSHPRRVSWGKLLVNFWRIILGYGLLAIGVFYGIVFVVFEVWYWHNPEYQDWDTGTTAVSHQIGVSELALVSATFAAMAVLPLFGYWLVVRRWEKLGPAGRACIALVGFGFIGVVLWGVGEVILAIVLAVILVPIILLVLGSALGRAARDSASEADRY